MNNINKASIKFADMEVSLESSQESIEQLTGRAYGVIAALLPDRMKLNTIHNDEEIGGEGDIPDSTSCRDLSPPTEHQLTGRAYA